MKNSIYLFPAFFLLSLASCIKTDYFVPKPPLNKLYGGSYDDHAASVIATTDGGYAFAGTSKSYDGDIVGRDDVSGGGWIVKLDKTGNIAWQKQIGIGAPDHFFSIVETRDGGCIAAGGAFRNIKETAGTYTEVWLVKIDRNGNIMWEKAYGGYYEETAYSIIRATDEGYMIAGLSQSLDRDLTSNHGYLDAWIIKIDENGNILWQKTYGGSRADEARSIVAAPDGGYIVAGLSNSDDGDLSANHGISDLWVFKIDRTGNLLWQKTFGGSSMDYANSIVASPDGGYVLAGETYSNDGDLTGNHGLLDAWVIKIDRNGNRIWQKIIGGSGTESANSITTSLFGGYVMAGSTYSTNGDLSGVVGSGPLSSEAWVVSLDGNGNIEAQRALGGSREDGASSIARNGANGFVMAGFSYSNNGDVSGNHGFDDAWVITLNKP